MPTIKLQNGSVSIPLSAEWHQTINNNFIGCPAELVSNYVAGSNHHLYTEHSANGGETLYLRFRLFDFGFRPKAGVELADINTIWRDELRCAGNLVWESSVSLKNKYCLIYRYSRLFAWKKTDANISILASSGTMLFVEIVGFRSDEARLIKETQTIFNALEIR